MGFLYNLVLAITATLLITLIVLILATLVIVIQDINRSYKDE